jgi:hypothetical protein
MLDHKMHPSQVSAARPPFGTALIQAQRLKGVNALGVRKGVLFEQALGPCALIRFGRAGRSRGHDVHYRRFWGDDDLGLSARDPVPIRSRDSRRS